MTTRTEQFESAFRAHGYVLLAETVPGQEAVFENSLAEGFAKVEAKLAFNAKHYGFRGLSKRALDALHEDLPNPCFGVQVL